MKAGEVIRILEEQSPLSFACDWDNVGLLAGDREKEVQKIYIALDATDEAIDAAVGAGADLLLTHHPLIFKGLKRVVAEDFIGRRIIKLIQNDMAYYAMHTNFDVVGMADLSAAMLGLQDASVLDVTAVVGGKQEGIGRVGILLEPMDLRHCAQFVKAAFGLSQVQIFGDGGTLLKKAAISPGSGKSEIGNAIAQGADVLITGDIDHHDGIDAVARGLCVIDAGHYGLEHIFIGYMAKYLKERCKGTEIFVHPLQMPFWVC